MDITERRRKLRQARDTGAPSGALVAILRAFAPVPPDGRPAGELSAAGRWAYLRALKLAVVLWSCVIFAGIGVALMGASRVGLATAGLGVAATLALRINIWCNTTGA